MTNQSKTKVLEVKEPSLPSTQVQGRGLEEGTTMEELLFPRAKLMQALSPEIEENSGLKPGQIINTLTGDILPEHFSPIFKFTNWIRFNPRNKNDYGFDNDFEANSVIWRSTDPNDPKVVEESTFGPHGEKPLATRFLNYFSYFDGVDMPVVISFSNSSFKSGKKLTTLLQFIGGDIWNRKYCLISKKTSNDKGTFFVLDVLRDENSTPEEIIKCTEWFNRFKPKNIKVDDQEDVEF